MLGRILARAAEAVRAGQTFPSVARHVRLVLLSLGHNSKYRSLGTARLPNQRISIWPEGPEMRGMMMVIRLCKEVDSTQTRLFGLAILWGTGWVFGSWIRTMPKTGLTSSECRRSLRSKAPWPQVLRSAHPARATSPRQPKLRAPSEAEDV